MRAPKGEEGGDRSQQDGGSQIASSYAMARSGGLVAFSSTPVTRPTVNARSASALAEVLQHGGYLALISRFRIGPLLGSGMWRSETAIVEAYPVATRLPN